MNSASRYFYLLHFRKILIIGSDVCHNRFLIGVIHIHVWKWEAHALSCSAKKLLLKILQNSQKKMCQSLFFNRSATLFKKRLWHRFFPANFTKYKNTFFYRTPTLALDTSNTSGRLKIPIMKSSCLEGFFKKLF